MTSDHALSKNHRYSLSYHIISSLWQGCTITSQLSVVLYSLSGASTQFLFPLTLRCTPNGE